MSTYRLMTGDVTEQLENLPSSSVQCVVTSPPYWALRDYGVDGQIGKEPTLQVYISRMVYVFECIKRVLRDDGCMFVNMGDGFDAKNLMGQPWRLAFGLQDAGWILRSDIIWAKPNPMPEPVRDRPTKSHEYVFLFSKKERYFYDMDAVKEKATGLAPGNTKPIKGADRAEMRTRSALHTYVGVETRNLRTVWTIAAQPSTLDHFASYPEALAERCILAGTSAGGACDQCGTPLRRVTELGEQDLAHQRACGGDALGAYNGQAKKDYESAGVQNASAVKSRILAGMRIKSTVGWVPTCACETNLVSRCAVLDPFSGTGTTGVVALKHGRDYIGIDISEKYQRMARKRLAAVTPLFCKEDPC